MNVFIIYALMGFSGALVSQLISGGFLELPSIKQKGKDKFLDLGCITTFLIGIIAGLLGDANPINAFMFGLGGESALKGILDRLDGTLKIKIQGKIN